MHFAFTFHAGIRMGRDRNLNIIVLQCEMEIPLCTTIGC